MVSGMKNYIRAAAVFLLLPVLQTAGAVKVSEGKIVLGSSFQMSAASPAEFECRITNPDPKPHRVMIRLIPGDSYAAGVNNCSPEVVIPPQASAVYRFPFYVGSEEKYRYSVFEDGVRQPGSAISECTVKILEHQITGVGILNDLGVPPGAFKHNRFLRRQLVPVSFRAGTLPENSEIYRSLYALIAVQPDFSLYTSEQFSALLQYVADGGLLIFADPEGALAAASTPLAELLPVQPLEIRTVPSPKHLPDGKKQADGPSPHEIKFLNSVALADQPGGMFPSLYGFPLLRERRYGLGTVRFLAFAPVQENFPGSQKTADYFIALLLSGPKSQPSLSGFRKPLDQLTGFAVPQAFVVRNILILYFALLLVILVLGFRWKRHVAAWGACTVAAAVLTAVLLIHVNRTLGKRGALAAVLRVENAQLPGTGRNYISLYSPGEVRTTVRPSGPLNLFEQLPFPRFFRANQSGEADTLSLPLDLRIQPDNTMLIREMNLAARTSRQIVEHLAPAEQPGPKVSWKPPRLVLDGNGIRLEPWKVPNASRAEAAFVLFPNGSKPAEIRQDGTCVMKEHDSAIADPLVENLRAAMEKSHTGRHAAVVVVSRGRIDHPGLDRSFIRQGKILTVYPAELTAGSQNILLPGEMVVLAPAEISSRMALDGGKINPAYSLLPGMNIALHLYRPDALGFPASFSSLKVKVTTSGGRVEPELRLYADASEKQPVTGKKIGNGEYLFSGKEAVRLLASPEPAKLVIEGKAKQVRQDDPGASEHWALLEIRLELRGKTGGSNQEAEL